MTEAVKKANKKYRTQKQDKREMVLNIEKDQDIIKHLEGRVVSVYLKELVRQDIARSSFKKWLDGKAHCWDTCKKCGEITERTTSQYSEEGYTCFSCLTKNNEKVVRCGVCNRLVGECKASSADVLGGYICHNCEGSNHENE